ncbi:MAG TPA: hypothetical protein VHF22_03830 [Planctomycetota bacterium]|nr:hypothetical protein [Planctomycetota bacterium]
MSDRAMQARPATRARSALGLALLALAGAALGAGCRLSERESRPIGLVVETAPPGAAVRVAALASPGAADARPQVRALGTGPVEVRGLVIVRKTYLSGATDYWLSDGEDRLPSNPRKPTYASSAYAAGGLYPLDLLFVASSPGFADGAERLRLDAAALADLWERREKTIRVPIQLAVAPPPAAAPRPRKDRP